MSDPLPVQQLERPGVTSTATPGEAVPATPDAASELNSPHAFATVLSRMGLGRYTGVALLLLFIFVFGLWVPDTFLTSTTLKTILATQGVTAIVALAVVFPLAAGAFDLSVASNVGLSALVCGTLMTKGPHFSPIIAVLLTLLLASAIGAVNGALIAFIRMNSFIATLGTSSLLVAALGVVGHGQYVGPFPSSFTNVTTPNPLGVPIIAVYVVVLALAAWYVLEHTPIGRRVFATGANPDAARLSGVRTGRHVFWCLVACGFGAGLAGVLLASSTGSVNETVGDSYLLPAYAAAFLATTQIKPGRFNVWGTMLAIVLLGTGVQGIQLVGAKVWVTNLFNGVALLGAVTVAIILEGLRGRREKARVAR